jgi:single-strand DNA-binding protein
MASINKVILLGRIGNVTVNEFKDGRKIVNTSLATNDSYKNKEGDWVEVSEWHRLVFSIAALAERASNIEKGDEIYAEGSIKTHKYTNKDGVEVEQKEVHCTMFRTMKKASKQNSTPTSSGNSHPIQEELDEAPF